MCDAHYVGPVAWPLRTIFFLIPSFKVVHSDGRFNIFPGKQRGNKSRYSNMKHVYSRK